MCSLHSVGTRPEPAQTGSFQGLLLTRVWPSVFCAGPWGDNYLNWAVQKYSTLYCTHPTGLRDRTLLSRPDLGSGVGSKTDGVFQDLMGSGIMEMTDI